MRQVVCFRNWLCTNKVFPVFLNSLLFSRSEKSNKEKYIVCYHIGHIIFITSSSEGQCLSKTLFNTFIENIFDINFNNGKEGVSWKNSMGELATSQNELWNFYFFIPWNQHDTLGGGRLIILYKRKTSFSVGNS